MSDKVKVEVEIPQEVLDILNKEDIELEDVIIGEAESLGYNEEEEVSIERLKEEIHDLERHRKHLQLKKKHINRNLENLDNVIKRLKKELEELENS